MKDEKLNNPASGSEKEQPEKGTEVEKKDEGGEKLLAGKFRSSEELVKAYQNLEADNTRKSQEASKLGERLAKLEGAQEMLQKQAQKAPQITAEERQKMQEKFKEDFNADPLTALYNYQRPYMQEINRQREELQAYKDETRRERERRGELVGLADKAREEDAELFDKLKPEIEKELRENEAWAKFENPYRAVLYHLKGKSVRKLAKTADTERESFVEGSSEVPPKEDKKKEYVQKIVKARTTTRL